MRLNKAPLIFGLAFCAILCFGFRSVSGQTIPVPGERPVTIQSRTGISSVLIGGEAYGLLPNALIIDRNGNPTRLDWILLPSDASVKFAVSEQGETLIESIKLEEFTK